MNAFDKGYLLLLQACNRRGLKIRDAEYKRLWRAWGAWAIRHNWI